MERDFVSVNVAVLAIADDPPNADLATVKIVADKLTTVGHRIVAREIVKDSESSIRQQLAKWITDPNIDVVIATGGIESAAAPAALKPLVTQTLPGFTDLFRFLAYQEIGAGAMTSNAEAADCDSTFVFVLPASAGAVRAALDKLIIPQLDHRTQPRNLVMSMPRLRTAPVVAAKPGAKTMVIPAIPKIPGPPPAKAAAVPVAIANERTAAGVALPPRLPAAPSAPPATVQTTRRVVPAKHPDDDQPTKQIELAKLMPSIAQSAERDATDAPTREIQLAKLLPSVPPGADPIEEPGDALVQPLLFPPVTDDPEPPTTVSKPKSRPTPKPVADDVETTEVKAQPEAPKTAGARTENVTPLPPAPVVQAKPEIDKPEARPRPRTTPPPAPGSEARRTPRATPPPAPVEARPAPRTTPPPAPEVRARAKTNPPPPAVEAPAKPARPAPTASPPVQARDEATTGTISTVGDLPRGKFIYPVKQRSKRKVVVVAAALLIVGAGAFFAVIKLFPDGEAAKPTTTAQAEPAPKPVIADAMIAVEPPPAIDAAEAPRPEIVIDEPDPVAKVAQRPAVTPAEHHVTAPPPSGPPPSTGSASEPVKPTEKAPPTEVAKPVEPADPSCDEVSCVLEKYARPCCERYRPAETSFKPTSGIPDDLDKTLVRAGVEKVKPVVIACGEKHAAKGTVKIALDVDPDGHVKDASVSESPDPALGDCVAGALRKAKFAKTVNGGSFTYPFAF